MAKSHSASGWEIKEKGWEKVQIKAFSSWLNGYLSKRDMEIQDIKLDLGNGVKLINFLELLSGKNVTVRYDANPPSRIQQIQNLHIALQFLQKEMDVRLISIGAEDIADGNLKMILGFLWSLFKRYRIQTIKQDGKSSEEGLLLWVKKNTEDYKDVVIESYKHSFKNGLAFLALCDKYVGNKELFDYDKFSKENTTENLTQSFDLAEKYLGIPKLLDPQEVSDGNVDERSLVLYISLFFHAFIAKQQQLNVEQEKNRIEEKMRGLEGSLDERVRLAADLEEENRKLRDMVDNLNAQLKAEQEAKSELQEKDTYLEEKVEVLRQLLEQEGEEKEELEKTKQTLEGELQQLKSSLQHLSKGQEESLGELDALRKKLEAEKERTIQLEENKLSLEEQLLGLKGDVSALEAKLNEERRLREANDEENKKRSVTQVSGLEVLKKNLHEHIEDLHRWQAFLDFDKASEIDFSGEIRPQILAEISKDSFDSQLASLASKLEKENAELLTLLKGKEAEAKARKTQEKKKKDRQKKSET